MIDHVPAPTASQMLAVASRHVDKLSSNTKVAQDFLLAGEIDFDKIDPLVGTGLFWNVLELMNHMDLEAVHLLMFVVVRLSS